MEKKKHVFTFQEEANQRKNNVHQIDIYIYYYIPTKFVPLQ